MGSVLSFVRDRLMNVMSGQGTTVDKRTGALYIFNPVTGEQAEAAYRTSWLVRKIVDIPPFDMTRERRDWQAEGSDIEKVEAEERRLQLWPKLQRALILARLYGGGALILGTADQDQSQPINPKSIGQGGLLYVHVMSRQQLGEGSPRTDPADPWFGQPDYFKISGANASQVALHPSRVIPFVGQRAPEGAFYQSTSWFWGDPIMQSIGEAVKNADMAQDGFASLIDEAKIDIVKMPKLTELAATPEGETKLLNRLSATAAGKSMWRMVALDAEDDWQQRQVTWSGMDSMLLAYLNIVAGAADIPLTRLLGVSPKGLQSNGDGEERDYHAMVKARQAELLSPALDRIDELLIPSALGSKPDDVYYTYAPLSTLDEKDAAQVELNFSTTIKNYADTGLIPDTALSAMTRNRIVESSQWPGSEKAFEEADANPEPDNQDPDQLTTLESRVAAMEQRGTVTAKDAIRLVTDASVRSLYVSRKLLNGDAFIKWAKEQGFKTTVPADELHVTIMYSREPVDWMKMGSAWDEDKDGKLRVPAGGARLVEKLGENAIVLLFSSSSLSWRHEDMKRNGASFDYDQYQPHVTITYDGGDVDLDKVEPFQGELLFGPEIFAEIDDDWTSNFTEDGGSRHGAGPFEDGRSRRRRSRGGSHGHREHHFDPSQPRDFNGRWTDTGALAFVGNARLPAKMPAYELGEVDAKVHRKLLGMGIPDRKRSVKLDQSRVAHILIYHGPGSPDRNPISENEIANAHHILAASTLSKGTPFQTRGIYRISASAKIDGIHYGGAFEVRRNSIVPLTLYRESGK